MVFEHKYINSLWIISMTLCYASALFAKTDRYRATWRQDPSTTIVIGWNQSSGTNPVLYYDTKDNGLNVDKYTYQQAPNRVEDFKGMKNTFVRLSGLTPNTLYHFVIKDSEGLSRKLSFQTASNSPESRLPIIAGGDSRNMREARIRANKLVGKLRPLVVLFGGDMSDNNTAVEWKEWFDDWQLTITPEGRITPILPCLGNHEEEPATLINLFDIEADELYYALDFGGSLLRTYTLNSFAAPGGNQKAWLKQDLEANSDALFKFAQYHLPMRPHTMGKEINQEEYTHWAPLFGKHGVRLAIECDAHVAKYTYPIRPSSAGDAVEGFVRDDNFGTVYIGEGGWGAPLRQANRSRTWTRNTESFNQFHWIWIDKNKMEIRTIKTDCVDKVLASVTKNPFEIPQGLEIWKPSNGEVVTIPRNNTPTTPTVIPNPSSYADSDESINIETLPKLNAEQGNLELSYFLAEAADIKIRVLNIRFGELFTVDLPKQPVGKSSKIIRFDKVPPGRYIVVLRNKQKLIGRYLVTKKS